MKALWYFIRQYRPFRWWVAVSVLLSCAVVLAQVGLLAVSGWFIAAMGIAGVTGAAINYFTPAAIIRTLAIIRTAGRYGERLVTHEATLRMTTGFRHWFYEQLQQIAPAATQDLHSADIFSRLRADIDVLERFFLQGLLPLVTAAVCLLCVAAAVWWVYPPLAVLVTGLMLVAGGVLPWWRHRRVREDSAAISCGQADWRITLTDAVQGRQELLVYGQAIARRAALDVVVERVMLHEKRLHDTDAVAQGAWLFLAGCAVVMGTWLAILPVQSGALPLAFMAMIPLLCLACFDVIAAVPAAWQAIPGAALAAERVLAVVQRPSPYPPPPEEPVIQAGFRLECHHPALRYADRHLRFAVDFVLAHGESLAITGASGAGKSSLVGLLCGLYPPDEGVIVLNGATLEAWGDSAWRAQFSVAEQSPYLFAGTLRRNLRLAAPDADDAALLEACRVACLPVADWPQGLESEIGEHGRQLSGGQRRRLALARALLKPAPCLVLDEPTEGLDAPLAAKVMEHIRQHCRQTGQALILISHDATLEDYCHTRIALPL